jgi:type IV fimbrial biogenesis protein FimT
MVPAPRHSGYTLAELVVVCSLLSVIAAVVVPALARTHGRASVPVAAVRFALVLRDAQARAWACGDPVRVSVDGLGRGYTVECGRGEARRLVESGSFGGAVCSTNYPGGVVEFVPAGYPHVPDGTARAGTFTFSFAGVVRRVVVQMGGAVRCL